MIKQVRDSIRTAPNANVQPRNTSSGIGSRVLIRKQSARQSMPDKVNSGTFYRYIGFWLHPSLAYKCLLAKVAHYAHAIIRKGQVSMALIRPGGKLF